MVWLLWFAGGCAVDDAMVRSVPFLHHERIGGGGVVAVLSSVGCVCGFSRGVLAFSALVWIHGQIILALSARSQKWPYRRFYCPGVYMFSP